MAVTTVHGGQLRDGTVTSAKVNSSIIIASGANAFSGDQSLGGFKLTNLGTPSAAGDATPKSYVDSVVNGLDWKASVRAATTANIDLSTDLENGDSLDGVTLATGDRVLVKNQSTGSQNGIYIVPVSGAAARATDADADAEVTGGLSVFVNEGTTNGNTQWALTTNDPITVGTTALVFAQVGAGTSYSADESTLHLTGTTFSFISPVGVTLTSGFVWMGSAGNTADTQNLLNGDLYRDTGIIKVGNISKLIVRETPSGTVNGTNDTFTLANTPVSGTEQIYVNGILQDQGAGNDYTISTNTITFLTGAIPQTNDKIRVTYIRQ